MLLISTSIVADMRSTAFIHIDDETDETCVVSVRACVCVRCSSYVCGRRPPGHAQVAGQGWCCGFMKTPLLIQLKGLRVLCRNAEQQCRPLS